MTASRAFFTMGLLVKTCRSQEEEEEEEEERGGEGNRYE